MFRKLSFKNIFKSKKRTNTDKTLHEKLWDDSPKKESNQEDPWNQNNEGVTEWNQEEAINEWNQDEQIQEHENSKPKSDFTVFTCEVFLNYYNYVQKETIVNSIRNIIKSFPS